MPYENLIKERRKELGMTQIELARRSKIRRDYLSKIENSKIRFPNVWNALNIAEELDTTVEHLWPGLKKKSKEEL